MKKTMEKSGIEVDQAGFFDEQIAELERIGDFTSARREYCELSGIPEKTFLPDPDDTEN